MTVMQKAITPQMSQAYLQGGFDRVAGFVVSAADVAAATTPSALFEVHSLGYRGSPFAPNAPYIDILRFEMTAQLRFENAVGGIDQQTRQRTGGPFVDRPPFTGLGFAPVRGPAIPLYWMVHSRVPAGSVLVRVAADGSQRVLARYIDVGHAWQSDIVQIRHSPSPEISRFVGPMAKWAGTYFNADVFDDAVVVVCEVAPLQIGFEQTAAGRWRRVVARGEVTELFEFSFTARWNDLEMRVVSQWNDAQGQSGQRVTYLGHDADVAEGMRLDKVEAGVYEANIPGRLQNVATARLVPPSWATA